VAAEPGSLPPVARLLAAVCRLVFRAATRIRVEGAKDLPQSGPLIVAPNHLSNADPPIVAGWLAPALGRRPRFLAKEQLFVGPVGALLRSQGVIPVKAGGSDADAYRVCRRLLDQGEVLVIFPEGTRSQDGVLGAPKPGVALLATRSGAPVLPVGISGTDAFLRRESRLPRIGARVTLRIGRPFSLSIDPALGRRESLEAANAELMRRIGDLVEERHRPPPGPMTPAEGSERP
jgi:1-acyl-sn-glycerol-3-phosphate acyltransferase